MGDLSEHVEKVSHLHGDILRHLPVIETMPLGPFASDFVYCASNLIDCYLLPLAIHPASVVERRQTLALLCVLSGSGGGAWRPVLRDYRYILDQQEVAPIPMSLPKKVWGNALIGRVNSLGALISFRIGVPFSPIPLIP